MPWTVGQVEEHNKGLSAKRKRQWVAVANSTLKKCMDDGGKEEICAAAAIRQANAAVKAQENEEMEHYALLAQNYTVREEVFQGKKHLVIPAVLMVEGVHAGSHGPLLHLAEDLGKFPGSWDGIPVSIQHPTEDGSPVSCNQPHVIDNQVVGRTFNTFLDGKKLRSEVWVCEEDIARIAPEALEYIQQGKPVDVSVGVFTEDDMLAGTWNEEQYSGIARNHRPDHLALLPGATGACSWSDGCGLRANEESKDMKNQKIQALIGQLKPDWLRELSQAGVSLILNKMGHDELRQKIQEQLNRKDDEVIYHSLMEVYEKEFVYQISRKWDSSDASLSVPLGPDGGEALFRQEYEVKDGVVRIIGTATPVVRKIEYVTMKMSLLVQEISHQDIGKKIQSKLDRMDDDIKLHFLMECYDDYFIYRVSPKNGPSTGEELYKRSYRMVNDEIEFTGEAQPVVKKTEYVNTNEEENNMSKKQPCCEEKVQMLIEAGLYTEDHRDRLMAMEEADIDVLVGASGEKAEMKAKIDEVEAKLKEMKDKMATMQANEAGAATREQAIQVLRDEMKDKDKFLALAPPEVRATLEHGQRLYQAERDTMVMSIEANSGGVLTKEYLSDKEFSELQMLAKAYPVPRGDYTPNGPTPQANTGDDEVLMPTGMHG